MEYIVLSVLMILFGMYILWPFASIKEAYYISKDRNFQRLLIRKDELYRAISDIDFEYSSGKISDEDYNELRSSYKSKAIKVIKELESVNNAANSRDDPERNKIIEKLEEEILQARKGKI